MGRVCAAVNCKSRQKKDSGISFHEFPHRRPEILKKWLENVRRDKWFPREKSAFLCSKHFLPECFESGRQTLRRLKDNAVPSVFDYNVTSYQELPSFRAKRLASSSAVVITSLAERNRLGKKRSSAMQKKRQTQRSELTQKGNSANSFEPCSLRKIGKNSNSIQSSPTGSRRKQTQHNFEENLSQTEEACISEKTRFQEQNKQTGNNLRCTAPSQNLLQKSKKDKCKLYSPFTLSLDVSGNVQSVTIVPWTVNEVGEISYKLLVDDCVSDSTATASKNASELAEDVSCSKRVEPSGELSEELVSTSTNDEINENPPMKCSYCRYMTRKRYLLSRHLKAHLECHPHKCDHCPCSFKTPLALQNHLNTHFGICPFQCRRCERSFTTSGELVSHIQNCSSCVIENNNKIERRLGAEYHCPDCSYSSENAAQLRQHLSLHTAETNFRCKVCDGHFVNGWLLKSHEQQHISKVS